MKLSSSAILYLFALLSASVLAIPDPTLCPNKKSSLRKKSGKNSSSENPPNVLLFIVDDMGWNQVGYHAREAGNHEIKTPNIDQYVDSGIEMNRAYMTPWCGPSRAAMQSGRTNVFNANISNDVYSFDDDIGYAGGMPPGTRTLAHAFKDYGQCVGKEYTTYFNGKWGIGGTAWMNTPLGMGYDYVRGFWGDSIEPCDGRISTLTIPPHTPGPGSNATGPLLNQVLPGYWDQNPDWVDNEWCPLFQSQDPETMSDFEKFVACKSKPRTPPKHIDEDLLENVVSQIKNHNYDEGPFLQVFATQMLHTPLEYPSRFDDREDMEDHFRPGAEKPAPNANDQRFATASAVGFMDYLFGSTMQSIKDVNQWENTIVIFTSDNGGSIYSGSVNNNYPLRAAKFTAFEGGVRVPQFITGGFIDTELGEGTGRVSNTYTFPLDLGPTMLQMAGARKEFLFGRRDKPTATYGTELWDEIKNSVTDQPKNVWQIPRNVSYGANLFFEVQEEQTFKHYWTGSNPILTPRHWNAHYPQLDDLLMDNSYYSVSPCRPGGTPSDCCKFELSQDPREFLPLETDCNDMHTSAQELFEIDGGCEYNEETQTWNNNMCIQPLEGSNITEHYAQEYSLWSRYGASGPFTNASGFPINPGTTRCVCWAVSDNIKPSEIKYFAPADPANLANCFADNDEIGNQLVPCEGLTFQPQYGTVQNLAGQGYNADQYQILVEKSLRGGLFLAISQLSTNAYDYATRKGFTEWANIGKMPYNTPQFDTCREKGISPVPFPVKSIVPYMFGLQNPTQPFDTNSTSQLCAISADEYSFCPSHDNAMLRPIKEWVYNFDDPSLTEAHFYDNTTMNTHNTSSCNSSCPISPDGTAYIGGPETLPLGIRV